MKLDGYNPEEVGSINIQLCDIKINFVVVCKFVPIQNVWRKLVVDFCATLWTEFNKVSIYRKLLQRRLQISNQHDPTHGSLSCYGQESDVDS